MATDKDIPEATLPEAEVVHTMNFDELPQQGHNWTDRGLKLTCENANHPYHEAWKRGVVPVQQ